LHANAYVSKPVDFDRFIEVVRQIDDFFVSVVQAAESPLNAPSPSRGCEAPLS
jgi:hypothetical protein